MTKGTLGIVERLRSPRIVQRERQEDGYPYQQRVEPTARELEAATLLEEAERVVGDLIRRFEVRTRDWVLSGDDSKALHHARSLHTKLRGGGE